LVEWVTHENDVYLKIRELQLQDKYLRELKPNLSNHLNTMSFGKCIVMLCSRQHNHTDSTVNVLVEDIGPGFPLKLLPNTTLMAGYSTKKSLGQGFTLMMKMIEQVLLSTVPYEGSTLILIFTREEGGPNIDQQSR
jgi:phosphoglycerate-specific signal transduction histidine kinase